MSDRRDRTDRAKVTHRPVRLLPGSASTIARLPTAVLLAAGLLLGLTSCGDLTAALESYDESYAQQGYEEPAATPTTLPIPLEREAVIASCGFTERVLTQIETAAQAPLQPFLGYDGDLHGTQVAIPETSVEALLDTLDVKLPPDYIGFRAEANYGYGPDKVAVIRADDQYDILRVNQTSGVLYDAEGDPAADVTTDVVISRLRSWEERYPLTITGAGFNWVEARLEAPPERVYSFAHEVYEFAPDVVDYWLGSVPALANDIHETQTIYLWWD